MQHLGFLIPGNGGAEHRREDSGKEVPKAKMNSVWNMGRKSACTGIGNHIYTYFKFNSNWICWSCCLRSSILTLYRLTSFILWEPLILSDVIICLLILSSISFKLHEERSFVLFTALSPVLIIVSGLSLVLDKYYSVFRNSHGKK